MKEIKFVDVGEGITEGHVQKWLVNDGDNVKEDQPVVQVETDKAVVNAPSPIGGKIKINVKADSIVHVGDILAYIGEDSEISGIGKESQPQQAAPQQTAPKQAVPQQQPMPQKQADAAPVQAPQPAPQNQEEAKAVAPVQASQQQPKEIIATPSVRKFARDNSIDLTKVLGTGPGGRILENDVKGHMNQSSTSQKQVPKFSEILEEKHEGEIERVPMTQTRKAIARNVELSLSIPAFTHMDLINATSLYDIIKKEKPNADRRGIKLTVMPFIIKATIAALKENPMANSSYDHDNEEIIVKKYYNIGLAAEAPDGLKVVVIRDADKKSIMQIAKEIQDLHDKILKQTITIDEMKDSTFTITNIGSLGGGFLSVPIINHPNVGILGIHLMREMPVVDNGQVKIGRVMPFSLVFDHRVVDGAEAVKFGNVLIEYLQDPEFLEMLG